MPITLAIIDIIGIPYDGSTIFKQGLGGSESAVTLMALELAQLQFAVTVFNNCEMDHAVPGVYDSVRYRPLRELAMDHDFDIVISSRTVIPFTAPEDHAKLNDSRAAMFKDMDLYARIIGTARMRILWMHDTFCLGDNIIEQLAVQNRITDIFTLSDWHLTYIANCNHGRRRNFEVLKSKLFITRNGVRIWHDEVNISAKDTDLFVYNASVTKGMIPLVKQIWPHVREHIPTARLKVIGGYYRFSVNDAPDAQETQWREMAADPDLAAQGIEFTGVIPQQEIANILVKANFMIYPAAFPETFGISTMESLCYNTPVITCRFGALEEIALSGACYVIDYAIEPNVLFTDINTAQQIEQFVKTTVTAYRNPYLHQQKQYYCNIVKEIAGWDSVALQWQQLFYKKLGLYLPRAQYRAASKINRRYHQIYQRRYHNAVELEPFKQGNEREIVVISPFRNCKDYIVDCIHSVASQDYDRYRHILIDDQSTDDTVSVVSACIAHLPDTIRHKFHLCVNTDRKGAVRNQIEAIRSLDNDDAIVMLLDGDDSLVNDNSLFNHYNTIYSEGTEFCYGSCWSMADSIALVSQPYPHAVKASGSYRQHHFNWILPYTHLRTFIKRLINHLSDDAFKDDRGEWYCAGGDGSVFYALIETADPAKVRCIQDIVMNYNDVNPLNDYKVNSQEQNRNARDIVSRQNLDLYSIIVPTMWRVSAQFVAFVHDLCQHSRVGEVIIIDNDNTKTPSDLPTSSKIKILDYGKNIYVNPAWNVGVAKSQFDKLCIVNDDVVFCLDIFARLDTLLTAQAGVFGLCPGVSDFDQPPITTGTMDIIPWSNQHTYGFGCLMFIHKASWQPIPMGLDIYYGDNFIFDLQLANKKINYLITNMIFLSQFAATTSDTALTSGFLERERAIYNDINPLAHHKSNAAAENHPVKESVTMTTQKKRILIAIPTAKNIEPQTFKAIYDLQVPEGYQITFQYFYGYNIDQIRNLIADWVVKGFDYLFSVDSDIAFAPDTLKRLLAHDKPIVSGLYIQRKPGQHILEIYEANDRGGVTNIAYGKIKDRGLVEVQGCGFGCVLVKAEVMRSIGYPQFKYHSALDHNNTVSEDVDFCRKALAKGHRIYADTAVQCSHTGHCDFNLDHSIPAIEAKLEDLQTRLRDLGSQRLIAQNHVNYLINLRDSGVMPRVIYDIGACVLHWTNEAARVWPDAEFVVFEAMASTEFLYREQGLKYHMGVLSDQSGRSVDFYQNDWHPGGNSYYRENPEVNPQASIYFNDQHKRTLTTVTLDAVVNLKKLPLPDLIKMDVQGAELDVLKGANETLKTVDHVILELQRVEYNKGAPLSHIVIDHMKSLGFKCQGEFCVNGPDGDYYFVRQ